MTILPRLDRFATLYVARPLVSMGGSASRCLPVLMYHSISETNEDGVAPYYRTCTSPRMFEAQLARLAEEGFKTVDLVEGKELLLAGTDVSRHFAITFDDGFRDFHTAAFPILKRYGFTATMFVPTAFIGNERRSFKERECLTWSEIRELRSAGMHFGSHTVNHPKLVQLKFPAIRTELHDSKETLEQELREEIVTFAYPYAFPQANREFSSEFCRTLKAEGYKLCTTTEVGRVVASDNPLRWKRLPVNSCDDPTFLMAKTRGAYDWLQVPQSAWKRLKPGGRGQRTVKVS